MLYTIDLGTGALTDQQPLPESCDWIAHFDSHDRLPEGCEDAGLALTHIPDVGSTDDLEGAVTGIDPGHPELYDEFQVATYIKVAGNWWTKPTFADPTVSVEADGTWTVDITTGGSDDQATHIASFLILADYEPPIADNASELPRELYRKAVDYVEHTRVETTVLDFAGQEWEVKANSLPVGPGPNHFSDSTESVWTDEDGLHLKIREDAGTWYSAEVSTTTPTTYGTHRFVVDTLVGDWDKNVILGLFAYSGENSEIDFEFGRWGEDDPGFNSQFVVQPWDTPGNIERFTTPTGSGTTTTHEFDWQPGSITFRSWFGESETPDPGDVIHEWTYTGSDIPDAGDRLRIHMNLWLVGGAAPSDGQEVEVVIRDARGPAGD
jgi:hypothetical protein